MKNWDYAIHSHDVKELGGPEKYIEAIRIQEYQATAKSLNQKWIFGTASALVLLTPFVIKGVVSSLKEYKE